MKTNLLPILKNHRLSLVALMMALFSVTCVGATTYYARANGNWNINSTWSLTSGGPAVGVGIWPLAGDVVYIGEGATARSVTIPANYTANCATIYMGSSSSAISATLTFSEPTSALSVSGNVIIYGPNDAVNRFVNVNSGTMTIGGDLELGSGQTGDNANRSCRVNLTTGTATVSGNLVFYNISSGSPLQTVLDMSGGACTFNLAGAFTITNDRGTLNAGTTSTFNYNGSSAAQTVPVGVSNVVYHNLTFNNAHPDGVTLGAAITATNVTGNVSLQSGILNNGGFAFALAPAKNFTVAGGTTFILTGISTMGSVSGGGIKTFGVNSTVKYNGTNQLAGSETYWNLEFNGTGTKTLPATASLLGNWTNNGTVDASANAGHIIFCGTTGAQTIAGTSITDFYGLTLNNPAGVVLGNDASVSNTLTLTNGILSTGSHTLIITNTAGGDVSGASASSYVIGNLHHAVAPGANSSMFPIGTLLAYAPVSFDFKGGTAAGILKVTTADGDHASIGTSTFNTIRTVNRTWTFSVISGLATASYDATFSWASADQDAAFAYTSAICGKYDGSSWTYPTMGARTTNSAQITGQASFSDFQAGNGSGPGTIAPVALGCTDQLVEVPVKVTSFINIGAISLTLNYSTAVLEYFDYTYGPDIDYVSADESGSTGILRISGIAGDVFDNLADYDLLINLRFTYKGGSTALTWNDGGDGTWCEYAGSSPEFIPYNDIPYSVYYVNGSVSNGAPVVDFSADNLLPATNTTVQLTDNTPGATSWEWSFDPPGTVTFVPPTDMNSQNPKVQFTDGGPYTVTLTVGNGTCTAEQVKVDYIRAGTPGVWTGDTSTDWYTSTNWDDHLVPTATIDVLIPTIPITTNYYPHLLGDLTIGGACNSITLTGTAELTVDGLFTVSPGKKLDVKDDAKVYATGH